MKTIDQLAEQDWPVALLRLGLAYGFFSKVLYENPTREFISGLASDDLFGEWPLAAELADSRAGLKMLREFCAQWTPDQIDSLQWDYLRLFVGPSEPFAAPWESFYLSREHLLFQEQTLAVRAEYRKYNLQAPHLNSEPDDHLGLEFAFLLHLCTLGQAALERGDEAGFRETLEAQRHFLRSHVLPWAPYCMQRVIDKASTGYYRGSAYLARGFLSETANMLGLPVVLQVIAA